MKNKIIAMVLLAASSLMAAGPEITVYKTPTCGCCAKWVDILKPRRAWFTHMSHDLHHADTDDELPPHIRLAYDGLRIPFEI